MAIIATAPVRHGGDRQHLDHDAVFALQPGLQRTEQVVAGIEHRGERRGFLFKRREMVRPPLEDLVHLVDGQASTGKCRRPPLARQQLVEVGQALGLLAISTEQLYHRSRSIGRRLGKLDQLLIARQLAGQQRVGEHLAQRRYGTARLALQLLRLDLVDGGELEDELHRQRPLVAFDEVEIGRRDAQPLGHRRLGQAPGRTDAADTRPGEDLLLSHRRPLTSPLQTCRQPVSISRFTILTILQTTPVNDKTGFLLLFVKNCEFSRLFCSAM